MTIPQGTQSLPVTSSKGPVCSEPLKELVGEGRNATYVKGCTELHLANRGIEKIRGFDRLVCVFRQVYSRRSVVGALKTFI